MSSARNIRYRSLLKVLLGGGLLAAGCSTSETPPPAATGSGGTIVTAGSGGAGGSSPMGGSGGFGSGGEAGGGGGGEASGGNTGTGGGGADASVTDDARDSGGPGFDGAGLGDARLMECAMPSIDRIQIWVATMGEGNMAPSGGTILVREGDHYVGKIEFFGNGWHVVPMYPNNIQSGGVDFSMSAGFNLTYSATSDFYVQMRPNNHFGGGTQWGAKIPSTMGVMQTRFIAFTKDSWGAIPGLSSVPPWPFEESRGQVRAFVFVGNKPNKITFYGLRFDNFVPMCRP